MTGRPDEGESPTLAATGPALGALGQYALGSPLGEGGMGVIVAAEDTRSGRPVAIKVMRRDAGPAAERFEREVAALAGLRHPAIVEYIDHGISPEGLPYLVMERLHGEDLRQRLARGPLTLVECVELGARVAEALALAHGAGLVHRDIKPSNIFLPDGKIERAKILDFGVARLRHASHELTRTGSMIGTLGFMAPEQARGEPDLDGRADLFSLGCVLYECVTGEPAFPGEHPMAVLAKILLDTVPRLRSLRPEVPPALDELVAALLAKSASERPPSAEAVAHALSTVSHRASEAPPRPTTGGGLTHREQRVFCLLLVRLPGVAVDPLAATGTGDRVEVEIEQIASSFGAVFTPILGHAGLISVELDAPPGDVALQSARCALAVRRRLPEAALVLATGRGERLGRSFVGAVIDRAMGLDERARPGAILVDDSTSGLLADHFVLGRVGDDIVLGPEREGPGVRMLLGRPAPFVGRAREIAWLGGLFRQVVEERQSRVALVTAQPGAGKSRLLLEFLRTLADEEPAPLVLCGRGSPLTRGAALGLLRTAVRHAAKVAEDDELAIQRDKLRRTIGQSVGPSECDRVSAFVGEIAGIHYDAAMDPGLPLARRDPVVMADRMRLAWLDWLRAECLRHPVVLVLEDLHWGDNATVTLVDAAVAESGELPLFVLGLARPEVHALFPSLWSAHQRADLNLPPLSLRASENMIRQVLGAKVEDDRMRTLAERANGNPLFLEELIRKADDSLTGELPETVLGVVQARLFSVTDEARRVLRAASVFGGGFSEAGLRAVLGAPQSDLRSCLGTLVQQELINRDAATGLDYRFRHALVRDAAYAMLTDADLRLAHRLAGEWLSGQDEPEVMAVAEHFMRAGIPGLALGWYRRAAEQALEGGDLDAAVNRAEQALACGATGEIRAELRRFQAEARTWSGDLLDAERWALEAVEYSAPGGTCWFAAIRKLIYGKGVRGELDAALGWLERAEAVTPDSAAVWGPVICLCEALYAAYVVGKVDLIHAMLQRVEVRIAGLAVPPDVMGHVHQARAIGFLVVGRFDGAVVATRAAVQAFEQSGDLRIASRLRSLEGHCLTHVGAYEAAEVVLRASQDIAIRLGNEAALIYSRGTLAEQLVRRGRHTEGRALFTDVLARCTRRNDPRAEGATRVGLGLAELAEGRLTDAEMQVRRGLELLTGQPALEVWARAMLAKVCCAAGHRDEGAVLAAQAAAAMRGGRGFVDYGCLVWWTIVECLEGQASEAEIKAALESGITHLREFHGRLEDSTLRGTLLGAPENVALVARARSEGLAVDDLVP